MSVILVLILSSLGLALVFLGGFIWAARSGQFEDTCTPALRVLADDETVPATRQSRSPGAAHASGLRGAPERGFGATAAGLRVSAPSLPADELPGRMPGQPAAGMAALPPQPRLSSTDSNSSS